MPIRELNKLLGLSGCPTGGTLWTSYENKWTRYENTWTRYEKIGRFDRFYLIFAVTVPDYLSYVDTPDENTI